jgi:hypothetical protein
MFWLQRKSKTSKESEQFALAVSLKRLSALSAQIELSHFSDFYLTVDEILTARQKDDDIHEEVRPNANQTKKLLFISTLFFVTLFEISYQLLLNNNNNNNNAYISLIRRQFQMLFRLCFITFFGFVIALISNLPNKK